MIVDMDIGNTRIKWRLHDAAAGCAEFGNCAGLEELLDEMARRDLRPERVRVCCVGRSTMLDAIDGWLAQRGLAPCQRARSAATLGGVTNGYREPGQLGVDRWLAVCAAYRLVQGACVVVDAGSALTLDVVDARGLHRGGYIVPGIGLQQVALREGTERVAFSEHAPVCGTGPGDCTELAVHQGIQCMLTGFIEKATRDCTMRVATRCELILTGGNAPSLAANLALPHRVVPDLVFQGIEVALP